MPIQFDVYAVAIAAATGFTGLLLKKFDRSLCYIAYATFVGLMANMALKLCFTNHWPGWYIAILTAPVETILFSLFVAELLQNRFIRKMIIMLNALFCLYTMASVIFIANTNLQYYLSETLECYILTIAIALYIGEVLRANPPKAVVNFAAVILITGMLFFFLYGAVYFTYTGFQIHKLGSNYNAFSLNQPTQLLIILNIMLYNSISLVLLYTIVKKTKQRQAIH